MERDENESLEKNEKDSASESNEETSSDEFESGHEVVDESYLDRVEVKLRNNISDFNLHIEYVEAVRNANEKTAGEFMERLKSAREHMSQIFPLPSEVWSSWIQDESRTATTDEENERIILLYKRALEDYQDVDLWSSYLNFVERTCLRKTLTISPSDLKKIRNLFEEALSHVGLHASKGVKIWESYLEFEMSNFKVLQEQKESKTLCDKQIQLTRTLYHRQLSIPIKGLQNLFKKYEEWEADYGKKMISPDVIARYEQALKLLEERREFEEMVQEQEKAGPSMESVDMKKVEIWKAYIDLEKKQGNPGRVICLYERAIKLHFLSEEIWKSFLSYLEDTLKHSHDAILRTHERAIRNCPWSGWLWASYLRASENAGKPLEEVQVIYERGLNSSLSANGIEEIAQLLNAFIDFHRRRLQRALSEQTLAFEKDHEPQNNQDSSNEGKIRNLDETILQFRGFLQSILEYLSLYFPDSFLVTQIRLYWSVVEARILSNLTFARELCEILVKTNAKQAEYWLHYVNLERYCKGDLEHCRSVFKRACHAVHDDPERIWREWVLFEREEGSSMSDLKLALERCREAEETQRTHRLLEQAHVTKESQARERKSRVIGDPGNRVRLDQKRKFHSLRDHEEDLPPSGDQRQERVSSSLDRSSKRPKVSLDDVPNSLLVPSRPLHSTWSESESRTAFVVNLPFSVDEKELGELFSKVYLSSPMDISTKGFILLCVQFGKVVEVRFPGKKRKGYAYVEFENETSAQASLELDQSDFKGRRLKVSISSPPEPKHTKGAL